MNNSNRDKIDKIVKNTAVLYFRLLVVMVFGLYTTRLILSALGENDYGTYILVAGVVGMLAFLQGAMSVASMRFLAHGLGSGQMKNQSRVFNTTLFLHITLGSLLVLVMEIGGIIMFKFFLNIPETSIQDAKIVFQFMVATTFLAIISAPYDAVITSHENLTFLSVVDVLGSILRLCIALLLTYSNSNLLIKYGFLMFLTQFVLRIIKQRYSNKRYPECRILLRTMVDKSLIKEILSFSGWSLVGAFSSMLVIQFKSILLNMFFGVQINTAQGIAQSASNKINTLSVNITQAIKPQLIKSEGSGNRIRMLKITNVSTKFSVFLFSLISLPVFFETPYLMNLWLKDVPEYSIVFFRLILIGLFIEKTSFEIGTAIGAVGNIKKVTIVESSTIVISIFTSYILFKIGFPPHTYYLVTIIFSLLILLERLYFGNRIAGLYVLGYLKHAILPVFLPIVLAVTISFIPHFFLQEGLKRFLILSFLSISTISLSFRYVGLTKMEYDILKNISSSIIKKILKSKHFLFN